MVRARFLAVADLQCACGARAKARVVDGGLGHITWSDDATHILRRWHHKSLVDDTPVCPTCAWEHFLATADLVDLVRIEAMLDKELA